VSTWVTVIHRVVITIVIQVQAVDGFGIQVGGIIGRDESAPLRAIVSSVAIVQAGIVRTIIAAGVKKGAFVASTSVYLF
jgi:hypothetical protein